MKIVFEEVRNYEQANEKTIYQVFDLNYSSDRKAFHDLVDEQSELIGLEEESKFDSESYDEVMEEAETIHEFISNQDGASLENECFEYFNFKLIAGSLKDELEKAGYTVNKSNASASLYVQVDGKEVRISNHKRPSVEVNEGQFEEHQYDVEIITDDNRLTSKQLLQAGIQLEKEVYYLD